MWWMGLVCDVYSHTRDRMRHLGLGLITWPLFVAGGLKKRGSGPPAQLPPPPPALPIEPSPLEEFEPEAVPPPLSAPPSYEVPITTIVAQIIPLPNQALPSELPNSFLGEVKLSVTGNEENQVPLTPADLGISPRGYLIPGEVIPPLPPSPPSVIMPPIEIIPTRPNIKMVPRQKMGSESPFRGKTADRRKDNRDEKARRKAESLFETV
eukprot:Protomagalhaensia_wolfi_Nauph_80__4862@NODE_50_length_4187_cov_153_098843_g41_i0_p3_GENE_NODE_50_length_4187_cov_153_098843_g41_i0NODE_50_length_4187_cov_153_098843_g41_i0_p3_ORF_typecomplete_len209_score24_30_NODE_50_length_4187_cov_153_098843_g41_i034874113